ncbi:MAG TPA: XylR N-terminal domain-containing protein [Candidatus Kapabacteria bacterium]|nr:XylR N-terminal domain-containing protein [Candidatus Kapabacteria bacterium]
MKATDFDFKKDLNFDIDSGITSFKSTRLAIFDVESIGLLRSKIIHELGADKAREIFLQFGYQQGFSDFMQMKLNYEFDSEMDLLASGPVIHTWEGIVRATPTEIRFSRETGEFFFTGVWTNSYEADQHLSYIGQSEEPVCWSLMGYASGWCSAFFGRKLIAIEPHCTGKGDHNCGWKIQPVDAWGEEAIPYINALKNF